MLTPHTPGRRHRGRSEGIHPHKRLVVATISIPLRTEKSLNIVIAWNDISRCTDLTKRIVVGQWNQVMSYTTEHVVDTCDTQWRYSTAGWIEQLMERLNRWECCNPGYWGTRVQQNKNKEEMSMNCRTRFTYRVVRTTTNHQTINQHQEPTVLPQPLPRMRRACARQ